MIEIKKKFFKLKLNFLLKYLKKLQMRMKSNLIDEINGIIPL